MITQSTLQQKEKTHLRAEINNALLITSHEVKQLTRAQLGKKRATKGVQFSLHRLSKLAPPRQTKLPCAFVTRSYIMHALPRASGNHARCKSYLVLRNQKNYTDKETPISHPL